MSTCCHRPTHTSVIHTFDCSNAFYICLFFVFVPSTCRSHLHPTNVFQRVYATICAAPWRLQKFIIHFTPHPYPTHTYKYIMTIPHQHGIQKGSICGLLRTFKRKCCPSTHWWNQTAGNLVPFFKNILTLLGFWGMGGLSKIWKIFLIFGGFGGMGWNCQKLQKVVLVCRFYLGEW